MIGVFGLSLALAVAGYIFIPKGFFPIQDTGFVLGTTEAAADISYGDMVKKHLAMAEIVAADPAVETFSHSVGVSGSNQTIANGRFWIALKKRGDRDVSASQFIDRIRPQLMKVPGIVLYLRAGQDINLSSGPSRAQYQYVLKSNDGAILSTWTQRLTEKLRGNPALPRHFQRPATGRQHHPHQHRPQRRGTFRPDRQRCRRSAVRRLRPAPDQRIPDPDQPVQRDPGTGHAASAARPKASTTSICARP